MQMIHAIDRSQYNPVYLQGDPTKPLEVLCDLYTKSEVKRLQKQGSIKVGHPHLDEVWIRVGKSLYIVQKNLSMEAVQSQIWYEYHRELMPKTITWKTL